MTGAAASAVTVKEAAPLVRPAAFVAVMLFGSFGSPAVGSNDHVVPARDQPVPRLGWLKVTPPDSASVEAGVTVKLPLVPGLKYAVVPATWVPDTFASVSAGTVGAVRSTFTTLADGYVAQLPAWSRTRRR